MYYLSILFLTIYYLIYSLLVSFATFDTTLYILAVLCPLGEIIIWL